MGTSAPSAEEQYHLKWNDYHSSLTQCFRDLRDNHEMFDVSIMSNGRTFKAHKLVLSACSPVFKSMLKKDRGQPFTQPLIFLHGVRQEDVLAILDFMYNGEVSVNQDDLRSFLSIAEDLKVRGLTQNDKTDDDVIEEPAGNARQFLQRKRQRSEDEDDEVIMTDSTPGKRPPLPFQAFPPSTPKSALRRQSSSLMDAMPVGNISYHYLGGRDHGDPLSSMMVTRSDRGWHCPDCIHIATTKGNLKSHILSGRHKITDKNYKCRFCDRSYSTRQSMQVHISTNHRQERDMEMTADPSMLEGSPMAPNSNDDGSNNGAQYDDVIGYGNDDLESANEQDALSDEALHTSKKMNSMPPSVTNTTPQNTVAKSPLHTTDTTEAIESFDTD